MKVIKDLCRRFKTAATITIMFLLIVIMVFLCLNPWILLFIAGAIATCALGLLFYMLADFIVEGITRE